MTTYALWRCRDGTETVDDWMIAILLDTATVLWWGVVGGVLWWLA
jgi:hypothetical protein